MSERIRTESQHFICGGKGPLSPEARQELADFADWLRIPKAERPVATFEQWRKVRAAALEQEKPPAPRKETP